MNNDLISREALKKDIEENAIELGGVLAIEVDCAKALIDIAPTVSQINIFCENADEKAIADMKEELQKVMDLRPQGGWITCEEDRATCNQCGFTLESYVLGAFYNFCPNCGADMRGGDTK